MEQLRKEHASLVRLHSSGDFYNAEYVRKWEEIAAAVPTGTFWAYARSWRVPPILSELKYLAALPNVHLWFSCDRDTGLPPLVRRVRACWLQIEEELPPTPRPGQTEVELVFRTKRPGRTVQKRIELALICPTYSGTPKGADSTCERCGVCWTTNGGNNALGQGNVGMRT